MSHIHVCLVSDQPIPNLTTILQFEPDKVILLATKDRSAESNRLEKVIRQKGVDVKTKEIKPYDMNNVISVCENLIKDYKNDEVTLNITGGTKIGTIGTYQVFYTCGKPIFYVNTQDDEIIKISPNEEKIPININMSIRDYLAAYGFNITNYVKEDRHINDRRHITEAIVQLAIKRPELIGEINRELKDIDKAVYPKKISLRNDRDMDLLCKKLVDYGLVERSRQTTIEIPDEDAAKYLRGFWFEEYLYMTAKSLNVNEVKLNVEGQWDASGKKSPRNEFDVLIAKRNRLFYISCKTANPDRYVDGTDESIGKDYLYELDALGDRALGLFGKKMLASARPVTNDYVKKRAEVMKIRLVDGRNIATMKDNLREWLTK
ncbi:MAG TPA: DUF1887 family CARF protein [Thermodesulfovibrionales bacterium]|nr:DUF1887 family CARF protein [Thermodesulfovibrionales bacterium]